MLVVLDANVLVSAAISAGPPHRVVQRWFERGDFGVVACPLLIAEITSVLLQRPRMRRWIARNSAQLFVSRLADTAIMMPDPIEVPSATRDAKDDYLVALARDAGADFIVTGDKDLLSWPTQSPPVIAPSQFEMVLSNRINNER